MQVDVTSYRIRLLQGRLLVNGVEYSSFGDPIDRTFDLIVGTPTMREMQRVAEAAFEAGRESMRLAESRKS